MKRNSLNTRAYDHKTFEYDFCNQIIQSDQSIYFMPCLIKNKLVLKSVMIVGSERR